MVSFDCVRLAEHADVQNVEWKCGWYVQQPDKEGKHRWVVPGQTKGKLRHYKDVPKRNGGVLGGDPPQQYSAPRSWEGKVEEVQELARRAAIKKKS
jgi:hypothetical protein